ncbi:MAG: response regulator [Chitinispirillaceae bacterium]|nr:response regulator [Chitinispirillaceae bacterium]
MSANDCSKVNILVVDDDPHLRELTNDILNEYGFTVFTADGGDTAIELLEVHKNIDLVITDIMMPGKEGVALIRAMRNKNKKIKIVAMTGMINSATVLHTATVFGADAVFNKPFKIDELINKINSLVFDHTSI